MNDQDPRPSRPWWMIQPRLVLVILLLFLFLVAIELLGASFKTIGAETAQSLIASVTNPFAGLGVGILATVMVQSSSVTTATIVGLVGSGQVPLEIAVPMIPIHLAMSSALSIISHLLALSGRKIT